MKRLISLLLLIMLPVLLLSSCSILNQFIPNNNPEQPDGDQNVPQAPPENLIYDADTEFYIVFDSAKVTGEIITEVCDLLFNASVFPNTVDISDPSYVKEVHEHEILIGETDRDLTETALQRLDRMDKNSEEDTRYCVYSDGSSLAFVYDDDIGNFTRSIVVDLIKKNYIKESLAVAKGVAEQACFNLPDRLAENDELEYAERWANLQEALGEGSEELISALKSFYTLYDGEKIIRWVANLYDKNICVCKGINGEMECLGTKYCGSGGFYYSNSARDNAGYLPDAESITQALSIIGNSGITYGMTGGGYKPIIPDWMAEQICDYLYSLQDPDGFFYHPQWGKDINTSRRGRDMNWCVDVLGTFRRPTQYPAPVSYNFDIGSENDVTDRLGASKVTAVSKAVMTASVPDHLSTPEKFKEYLISLDIPHNSYAGGNQLSAQGSQILARGEEYGKILIDHLNECQYDNGTWNAEVNYMAINGVMKISGSYERWEAPMPNAEKICAAAFEAISAEEPVVNVVDIWNPWVAVNSILFNIKNFGEGPAKADEIRERLYPDIADAIIASRDKVSLFKHDDGSFSYGTSAGHQYSSATSQGAPAAVPNSKEGDVNATTIATNNFTYQIFDLLGTSRIPFALTKERFIFLNEIENLPEVVKKGGATEIGDPIDFEYDDIGEIPTDVAVPDNGRVVVVEDPRGEGNVLQLQTILNENDYLTVNSTGVVNNPTCQVFEGEFCFTEFKAGARVFRLEMGREGDKNNVYRIDFVSNGKSVSLYEVPSYNASELNSLELKVAVGEWFKLRLEYYVGTADTVRIKVYFNDELAAVTDTYYDGWLDGEPGVKLKQVRLFSLLSSELTILCDDLHCYNTKDMYKPEALAENYKDNVNVDKDLLPSDGE